MVVHFYCPQNKATRVTFHPGKECGPCQLCAQTSPFYSHPCTWDDSISGRLFQIEEAVSRNSCICRACEKHTSHQRTTGHGWRPNALEKQIKCILPGCKTTAADGVIVHSGLVTAQQIERIYEVTLAENTVGQLVPLCQAHYKHLHRLLNADIYEHTKCYTCNATIKGSSRHCPDPSAIKLHLEMLIFVLLKKTKYAQIAITLTLRSLKIHARP